MRIGGHKIIKVNPDSIAEEMGVEPGMYLISVNGVEIEDVFDYQYLMEDTEISVLIRDGGGEETLLEIEKDFDEDFGVEFDNSLMDEYRSCCNRCIFCFIDQMPPGMRDTLYFKDDDSRLSFLQGNYITLTNMRDKDIDRIIRYHMEPINISVHTTNPALRRTMLGNRFAGDIFPKMRRLRDAGITMNGQIVLCRGINDGDELERSIRDLAEYRPAMQSVSVVPVGLTKYRDGLAKLMPFDRESASCVIDTIEKWQKKFAAEDPDTTSPHFIHASDEWYILAGRELPDEDRYDGYLQLENGVGMVRLMENEIRNALEDPEYADHEVSRKITVVTGMLIRDYLKMFSEWVMEKFPQIEIKVQAIRNDFFGERITVSGLITGQDLIAQLKELIISSPDADPLGEELLIPVNMLRSGEKVFLDDLTTDDVERELGIPVRVVWSGGNNFVRAVLGLSEPEQGERQVYES
ncbi:MAG TPA: radical SAM protein [Lachnospiraceae bacterium]|nr:radical SAM protein [Lachnospiraceae bacterium]